MREKLNDQELEQVVGGAVIISKDYMNIGFSTTKEKFNLKKCTYREARNYVDDLLDDNPNLSNAAFDRLVKKKFHDRGWIEY